MPKTTDTSTQAPGPEPDLANGADGGATGDPTPDPAPTPAPTPAAAAATDGTPDASSAKVRNGATNGTTETSSAGDTNGTTETSSARKTDGTTETSSAGDTDGATDADGGPGADPRTGTTAGSGPRAPRRAVAAAVTVGGGTAATALGTLAGLWFIPFLVGAVAGTAGRFPRRAPRPSRGYLTASLAAVLGWALPLAVQALGGAPVGEVARTTAALAGLPPLAGAVVAIALLIALVQALLGVWVGRTLAAPGRAAADRPAATGPTA